MSFMIKNVQSGMVLDVKESNPEHGTEVILYPYHGYLNQRWTYRNGMIISELNGYVLDINPKSNTLMVSDVTLSSGPKWYFNNDLTIGLKNGKVLDIIGSGKKPCTRVTLNEKHGTGNQLFSAVPYDEEGEEDEEEEEVEKKTEEKKSSCESKKETESVTSCCSNLQSPMSCYNQHFPMQPYPMSFGNPYPIVHPQHMPMFPYPYPWYPGHGHGVPHYPHPRCSCTLCLPYSHQMNLTDSMKNCKLN